MSDDNITVGSSDVELGARFAEQAQNKVRAIAKKHLGNLTGASVHVAQEGRFYRCSVNMQMGSLKVVTGEGKGKDVPLAFRTALGKAAKQLRRTKRLLREDRPNRPERVVTA